MLRHQFRLLTWFGLAGSGLALLSAHAAVAQCVAFSNKIGVELCDTKITDTALAKLRGGFELVPGVKAYFAFSQIVKLNGETVQSIIVPQLEISAGSPIADLNIAGNGGTSIVADGNVVPMTLSSLGTQAAKITTSPLNTDISIVTSANNGATQIASRFIANGITSQVANAANNTAVSTATTISLATQGLPAFVQAQRVGAMLLTNLQRTQTISP